MAIQLTLAITIEFEQYQQKKITQQKLHYKNRKYRSKRCDLFREDRGLKYAKK